MSRNRNKERVIINNVEIEAVAAEGNALAHVDGKVLFVPKCIPGDIVDVQLTRSRKGFMQGNVIKMIKPSPIRVEPFCPHYGVCGGCTWQALPYPKQLEFKQQQVIDQLTRIGRLTLPAVSPILGSEETEGYRNKLEYTFSDRRWILDGEDFEALTDKERLGLGFHIPQMFSKVLDIKECKLQREPSNSIRLFVKKYAVEHGMEFFNIMNHTGLLRNLVIRTSTSGEVMVILVTGACRTEDFERTGNAESRRNVTDNREPGKLTAEELSDCKGLMRAMMSQFPEISSMYYVVNDRGNDSIGDSPCIHFAGTEFITEEMEGIKFRIGPKSFYQTNSRQAYRLYSIVRDFAALKGDEVLYDLYTGTGTIALFLSGRVKKVVGIEYVKEAIEDAKENAKANSVTNSEFIAGDMKDVLNADFIKRHGQPDVIVLDPPRAGIHPAVAQVILAAAPKRIVYVSCNPASQARDLSIMSSMYEITAVQPVDMFPHTQHVENVVALRLKEKE